MLNEKSQEQWSALYRQALLESDHSKLQTLIEAAEKAIQQRARQLWYAGTPHIREQRDLDLALRFLA